jgi:hypothetical protein
MIDEPDFSLADTDGAPLDTTPADPAPASAPVPAPVIVVEYRQRGMLARLTPPLLILVTALAITSYQRKSPVRLTFAGGPATAEIPRVEPAAPPATPGPEGGASAKPDPVPPAAAPDPVPGAAVVPSSSPIPDPAPVAAPPGPAAGSGPRVASPFEFNPDDGLRPLDPAQPGMGQARPPAPSQVAGAGASASPNALPGVEPIPDPAAIPGQAQGQPAAVPPDPEPSKEAILQDIQREAADREQQRQNMEELKPKARRLLFEETVARINATRKPFRDELREALKSFGPNAGSEIEVISSRYGREMPPEIKTAYNRTLNIAVRRLTRQEEVNFMRACGLPETVILDYLAHKLHRTLNTRGGPRDENEVRVRAAQLLLSLPVVTPHPAASAEVHP